MSGSGLVQFLSTASGIPVDRVIAHATNIHSWIRFAVANGKMPAFYVGVAIFIQTIILIGYLAHQPTGRRGRALRQMLSPGAIAYGAKRLWFYAVPKEIVTKRSFLIDLQFYLLSWFGLASLAVKALAVIFLLDKLPLVFGFLGLDDFAWVQWIRSTLDGFDPWTRRFIIFVVAYLSYDFSYYWAHRWAHRFKFLWSFHKVHHYSTQINLLANYRFHPLDTFFQSVVTTVFTASVVTIIYPLNAGNFDAPTSLYGTFIDQNAWWYASFVFFSAYINRLNHSHFPIHFGRLGGKILVAPAYHMIHHSKLAPDHNFGASFSIWDYLFGTHYEVTSVAECEQHLGNLGIAEMPDEGYRNILQVLLYPITDAYHAAVSCLKPKQQPTLLRD